MKTLKNEMWSELFLFIRLHLHYVVECLETIIRLCANRTQRLDLLWAHDHFASSIFTCSYNFRWLSSFGLYFYILLGQYTFRQRVENMIFLLKYWKNEWKICTKNSVENVGMKKNGPKTSKAQFSFFMLQDLNIWVTKRISDARNREENVLK